MTDRTTAYVESRPTSQKLYDEAVTRLAGGVAHDSRYVAPFPLYIERAKGSRKWDVDGHEYIDYSMGSASLLLGHAHPDVVAALVEQAPKGTFYGSCTPLEVEWAGLVQQLIPSAEQIRFVGSGTEATMLAIRVARAFTGKSKIIRFEGHYHGWHDHVAVGMQAAPSVGAPTSCACSTRAPRSAAGGRAPSTAGRSTPTRWRPRPASRRSRSSPPASRSGTPTRWRRGCGSRCRRC